MEYGRGWGSGNDTGQIYVLTMHNARNDLCYINKKILYMCMCVYYINITNGVILHLFNLKIYIYCKNNNTVKYYYNTFFIYMIIFQNVIYPSQAMLIFQQPC